MGDVRRQAGLPHRGQDDHRHDGEQPVRHESEPAEPVEALMARTAEGDEEAFAGIYDALAQAVMGLACRILRDAAQAEEVTQDVMIEVWRTADRFRPERGSAKAWVLTLAHRRAVDRVRSAQASTEREQRAGVLAADRAFDQVTETVEGHDERRRVRRCLASLARLQRVPLVLAYYQGMTYVEVARSLSTPEGTVKSRMRNGLEQLRRCLEAGS
ncbi:MULTISPECIES: ECF RNA polymerase sigma factor SigK [unclassified Streptomyces]|uniref:ECF RNA polymerase sigma factor SigK n=1 Tax=Streptomyces sp. NPDC127129 TaxID=3345373 RepID=UPI00362A0038